MKVFGKIMVALGVAVMTMDVMAQTTLADCHKWAGQNYPLLKRYDLVKAATDYTVANANKGWLPQLSIGAQATLQSDVMTLPDGLQKMMAVSYGIHFNIVLSCLGVALGTCHLLGSLDITSVIHRLAYVYCHLILVFLQSLGGISRLCHHLLQSIR